MDFCKRDSIYIPPSTCDECVSPTDYNDLRNKPSINGVELEGNVTSDELNLVEKDGNKVLSDENFSTSDKIKLDNIESGAQANVIESITVDGVGLPVIAKEVDIPAMVGATALAPGAAGVVPAPSAGDDQKFLRGDGTWQTAGGGGGSYTGVAPIDISGSVISHDDSGVTAGSVGDMTNQTPAFGGTFKALSGTVDQKGHLTSFAEHTVEIPDDLATSSTDGLMSAADKDKLDNIESGAQVNQDAFGTITISGVDVEAQSESDTVEFIAGSNVTLTPDAVNGTITFEATDTTYTPASASPLMDGTAAVGTSAKYAREDHVHPTDTSRAPVNSPAFTGTPTAPTAALSEDSTIIATTEYVRDVFRDIDPVPRVELVPTEFSGTSASSISGNCHGMYIPVLKLAILIFNFTLSSGSAGTTTNLFTIPSAYRPSSTQYGSGYGKSSSATGALHVLVNSSGQVRQNTMSACTGGNGVIVYQVP